MINKKLARRNAIVHLEDVVTSWLSYNGIPNPVDQEVKDLATALIQLVAKDEENFHKYMKQLLGDQPLIEPLSFFLNI